MDYQIVKDGKSDFYIVTSEFDEYARLIYQKEVELGIYDFPDLVK
jgi:hypothetical protein